MRVSNFLEENINQRNQRFEQLLTQIDTKLTEGRETIDELQLRRDLALEAVVKVSENAPQVISFGNIVVWL